MAGKFPAAYIHNNIPRSTRAYCACARVCDIRIEAKTIQPGWGGAVGQIGKLRPIVNRLSIGKNAHVYLTSGGSQPPRRLPPCPTSRQLIYFLCRVPLRSVRWVRCIR